MVQLKVRENKKTIENIKNYEEFDSESLDFKKRYEVQQDALLSMMDILDFDNNIDDPTNFFSETFSIEKSANEQAEYNKKLEDKIQEMTKLEKQNKDKLQ